MTSLADYIFLTILIYITGLVATVGSIRLVDQLGCDLFRSREKTGHPDVTFTTVMILFWPLGLVAVIGVFSMLFFGELWTNFIYKLLPGKKQ